MNCKVFRYCAIFPIGLLHNSAEIVRLEEELNLFGDILQGDYLESYNNLSLKTLSALRYAAVAYPTVEAIMKIDDDVAWNVPKVANYIKQILPRSISCYKYDDRLPVRKPTSKWYTSYDEYPQEKFPPYCSGVAYIIHKDALMPMLEVVPEQSFFWIDDVFITGFLTRSADIVFVKLNQFTALKPLRKELLNITFYSDHMFYGNHKENIGRKFEQRRRGSSTNFYGCDDF
ncbi:unnamed protein product [Cylicocyclus nassatus]|uniref:Hexosyltransferase n=1 Tax=Cylicocyclus nassatus TaxID=53992 RepID=A0AA36HDG1_CYLNA|nr:unnamed protein product [Cylicocyclus nassatus]